MRLNRRLFLRNAGVAAATPLLFNQLVACSSGTSTEKTVTDKLSGTSLDKFGIQLWTVKEDLAKDTKGTLKALSEYGYKQIESFQGEKGIFWGLTPADFKKYMDDLGMNIFSSHCNPDYTMKPETEDEYKKLVDDAAGVGMKYLINPFLGSLKTEDEWKKAAEGLNRQGEICKKAGLRTAYHNHHFEFIKFPNGISPEQILFDGTNPELVDFELDLYWAVKAKEDPEAWMKKYSGRIRLCHVKDLYRDEKVTELEKTEKSPDPFWPIGASTIVGQGKINFPQILKTAKENGAEYFIVEQERFDNTTPLAAAKADADYMKSFKFA